jgi:D-aspartate ligase
MPISPDVSVPVVLLKTGHYPIHHGTVGVFRSLGRLGVPVYALVEDYFTPAGVSRYLRRAFVADTRSWNDRQLLTSLTMIAQKVGTPAILVPTDDNAAVFIAEHAGALQKWFLMPPVPTHLPRMLANKKCLYSVCSNLDIPAPASAFPSSMEDVEEFLERATFPVIVKAAEPQRLPPSERRTRIVHNAADLKAVFARFESADPPNVIFQEYIPESCGEDWIYHGYANAESGLYVSFTGRKLRSYPPFAGMTAAGVPVVNEQLRLLAEHMLKAISFSGIVDLDYRLDKRDGQYKLLDFNPRVGANFRMFEDESGVDVIRAMHLDLTGRSMNGAAPMRRRTFIVESYDPFAAFGYLRRGELTLRGWWRSVRGRKELAWFAWDDPLPSLVMWVRLALRATGRALSRQPRA